MSSVSPQSLWPQIRHTFASALETGALEPIPTSYEWVEQDGIAFLVRIVDNLWRKERAAAKRKASPKPTHFNPFLPYEEELFVGNLSPSHCVLLNKFNVMDHHILIVTREFEAQTNWLTLQDFEALQLAMQEIEGLGFYNGGTLAGASQPHKHLQLVPLPLADGNVHFPFAPCLDALKHQPHLNQCPFLPYGHRVCPTPALNEPEQWFLAYTELMENIGMGSPKHHDIPQGAYNFLITRQWMMAVPRSQEHFEGISINSLGFAGALLVKNEAQLNHLKTVGPMNVLKSVGCNKL